MNHGKSTIPDPIEEDDMPAEIDFSRAERANTAYRFGEVCDDELQVERFLQSLGLEVIADLDSHREPNSQRALNADFLLRRNGLPKAICELKSIDEFDYFVTVNHEEGTSATSGHRSLDSDADRVIRLASRASEQLAWSNPDRSLINIFAFANHLEFFERQQVEARLLALTGIDATFWFDVYHDVISKEPVIIAADIGLQKLQQLGLKMEVRLRMTPAA